MTTPTRKINLVRIAHINYTYQNLERAEAFFRDFGFVEASREGTRVYYRGYGPEPFVLCAEAGTKDGFGGAAFAVESEEDLYYASRTLSGASKPYELSKAPGGGRRLRNIEMRAHFSDLIKSLGPAPVHKLGHFGACVTDFQQTYDFFTTRFNFIPSDVSPHLIPEPKKIFLRLDRGDELVDHHSFFFFEGPKFHVHHASFETHDSDLQFLGHDWLRERGFDPSKFIFEHYVDGDQMNSSHPPNHSKASPDSLHIWGPDLPEGFLL
ncbi:glyoxalase family protein [Colletotrichum fioriniae PJ7]|uniref:Glyoxalase family protein n=1 Tax=Colletotrichum fioriniae PJ7 TaxID=1445577 RepID=A0A010RVM0_9PEZI|nr:glyoxalase family protein [Colletotrichum fioriniae PJ7]